MQNALAVRSTWSWTFVDQLRKDVSYAARGLWRAPGFTAAAVAILAFGVGANLTLFQILDAAVVHRYSLPDAERFVRLSRISNVGTDRTFPSSAIDFYRANASSFGMVISEDASFTVVIDGTSERRSAFVSDNYFSAVGI